MTTTTVNAFFPLSANTVDLSETATQWAARISQPTVNPDEQWEGFIQAIAIAGFKQWLGEGSLSLNATYAEEHVPNTGINLQVEGYQICVIASNLGGEEVSIDLAETPHLYVLVAVREEANQVDIIGALDHKRLVQFASANQATTYQVPTMLFTIEPEQMLLYFSCLEPDSVVSRVAISSNTRREMVADQAINVGLWLQDQVDELAAQLSWRLLPPPVAISAMRPVRRPVEAVVDALSVQGVQLPTEARGASGLVNIDAFTGQLYAWAWPLTVEDQVEWRLLLLLGPALGQVLPAGVQLQVSDSRSVLVQESLSVTSVDAYLYTQVQGTQAEKFWLRIILPGGAERTLPAFEFKPKAGVTC